MKTIFLILCTLISSSAVLSQNKKPNINKKMEIEITQQIKNLFAGADKRDWEKVAKAMSDSVLLDYSSMTGNPAAQLSKEQIVSAWSGFLPGFDRTEHKLSDFKITINGTIANANFVGKADHFLDNDWWFVHGTYDAVLQQENGIWKITSLKLNFIEQKGNKDLPASATKKMQQANKKN